MLLDLPSRQDFETLQSKLDAVLAHLTAAATPAADELLSIEHVAEYTRFDRRTVEKWVAEGQFNESGKRIYLPAHKYSGRLRFKRADVEAFGLGVGVLEPSHVGVPIPTKKADKAIATKKKRVVTSEQAMRRVA